MKRHTADSIIRWYTRMLQTVAGLAILLAGYRLLIAEHYIFDFVMMVITALAVVKAIGYETPRICAWILDWLERRWH